MRKAKVHYIHRAMPRWGAEKLSSNMSERVDLLAALAVAFIPLETGRKGGDNSVGFLGKQKRWAKEPPALSLAHR